MPYSCMCHLVLFTVPFITMWSHWGWHKEERPVHSTGVSSTDIANDLWYYCVLVRQAGFSLCSQMWQGYLYPVVSSLNAPAVTLLMPVSSLFLVLQTVLDRGALKCIYKRQEIVTPRWRDIECWAWIHVWTGPVWAFLNYCMCDRVFLADKA